MRSNQRGRSKCVLATYLPKLSRPDLYDTLDAMARVLRLGRSARSSVPTYLLLGTPEPLPRRSIVNNDIDSQQESGVMSTNDPEMTHELHVIRAHILHYESLLSDFRKTIQFVEKIHNPALVNTTVPPSSSSATILNGGNGEWKDLLDKECEHMLSGVDRLQEALQMHDKRLRNVMNLVPSSLSLTFQRNLTALICCRLSALLTSKIASVWPRSRKQLEETARRCDKSRH